MAQERKGYGGSLSTRLNEYFQDVDFPAHRDELVAAARKHKAEEEFVETLDQLPEREFGSFDEVMDFFGRKQAMGTMHVEGDGHDLHEGDDPDDHRKPRMEPGMQAPPGGY